jgi:integrase
MNRRRNINKAVDRGVVLSRTKTGKQPHRSIVDELLQTLEQRRALPRFKSDTDFVFCNEEGGLCDPDMIRNTVLYLAVDRVGIKRLPRALRVSCLSLCRKHDSMGKTSDLKLCQTQLGHKCISTTANVYMHPDAQHAQRAAEALADGIFGHQTSTKSLVDGHQGEKGSDTNSQVQ